MSLRQLRDTRRLKALLKRGEPVELCDRNRAIATISPAEGPLTQRWPDFPAVGEVVFGGRILSGADLLSEIRRA